MSIETQLNDLSVKTGDESTEVSVWTFDTNKQNDAKAQNKPKRAKKGAEIGTFIDRLSIEYRGCIPMNQFFGQKIVANFIIDKNISLSIKPSTIVAPQLKLPETFDGLNEDLALEFHECYENNKLITNYREYRDFKWQSMLKMIQNEHLLSRESPHFVSFAGPIGDIIATPNVPRDSWSIDAVKFNGSIFLLKSKRTYGNDPIYGEAFKSAYCGLRFLYTYTERHISQIDEFKKHFGFIINNLGEHKLMIMTEIDAIDKDDEIIDLKVTEDTEDHRSLGRFNRNKSLKWWSQCVVTGVKTIVIGKRSYHNILLSIEKESVDAMPEKYKIFWSDMKCLHFLDRFLQMIKDNVTQEMVVYEFRRESYEKEIECYQKGSDAMLLPEWFINPQLNGDELKGQVNVDKCQGDVPVEDPISEKMANVCINDH